jgi:tyrosinase
MVDKVWYDWQNANPENFWSFIGGSVNAHSQPGLYAQFPVGGPPFLNVSKGFSPLHPSVVADSGML